MENIHFLLTYILENYSKASGEIFPKHPIAKFIRKKSTQLLYSSLDNILPLNRYLITGSPGQGQWADIPWIGIFDILITTSAQSGFYPVFLFKEDMSGVYLSLNQGITTIKNKLKGLKNIDQLALEELKYKAKLYRLSTKSSNVFSEANIILKENAKNHSLAKSYEAGNIVSKFYSRDNIPNNEELRNDIIEILTLYQKLIFNNSSSTKIEEGKEEDKNDKRYQEKCQVKYHKRVERNQSLSKKVKEAQGYKCKVCNFNFEDTYGIELGKEFIEAHHLKAIAQLKEEALVHEIHLDPHKDFIVLCPNCHRMIHKLKDSSDYKELKRIIEKEKNRQRHISL